jgi:hypothetical protein
MTMPNPAKAPVKAFLVSCTPLGERYDSIAWGLNRAQAQFAVWRCANEAGYNMSIADIRSRRAPEYDDLCEPRTVLSPDFAKRELEKANERSNA